jgi:hypothetical protein
MAVLVKVNAPPSGVDNTQRRQIVQGVISNLPANYTTNGVAFTWAMTDWQGGAFIPEGSGAAPIWTDIESLAGNVGLTYVYDPVHGTLRIAQNGTELGNNVAIPADTIGFKAEFARGY